LEILNLKKDLTPIVTVNVGNR